MRFVIVLYFGILTSFSELMGQNLVPNHSFEQLKTCDLYFDEFKHTVDWQGYNFTPDIFNACSKISFLGVPNNVFDKQYAADGKGYAGILTYHRDFPSELIGTKLKEPVKKGVKYFVRFKVSRAEAHAKYASDNLGVLFTNEPQKTYQCGKAHILSNKVITESNSWEVVSGVWMADDDYEYMVIGNFFDHRHTSLQAMPAGAFEAAYYFIDDVQVSRTTAEITPISMPQRVNNQIPSKPNPQVKTKNNPSNEGYALSGRILDADTKQPLAAWMELSAEGISSKEEYETDYIGGQYAFTNIPNPQNFNLKILARNYYPVSHRLQLKSEKRMKKDFYLYPLKAGQRIELKYVEFKGGTAELIPEAYEELNKLTQILRDNPLMKIEIQGYTDRQDDVKLALDRAKAVQNYLVQFGKIDKKRLEINALYQVGAYKEAGNAADEERKKERIEIKILN
jgi:outer membrane protein OmpA-like peptidoglycan-associated protein